MTILNLMLGAGRGGLEQASLDYAEALQAARIDAVSIVAPDAWVQAPLASAGLPHETFEYSGRFDFFAGKRLRKRAEALGARAILCHGNRALSLALRGLSGHIPVIAVAHNYSTRRFAKAERAIALTEHLAAHVRAGGNANVDIIPNMVRLPTNVLREPMREPPVIGSMGRLHAVKGMRTFVDACAVLNGRGVQFRAVIGGDGDERESLQKLIAGYGLEQQVTLSGWVKDKYAFFAGLDVFVLPSHQEAFGIALLEAMSHRVPVVASAANGPRQIVENNFNGLLVPVRDAEAMADAIAKQLANTARAAAMAATAEAQVAERYSLAAMAGRLQTILAPYM